jgi:acyl-CoA dehydrogenase
MQSQPMNTLLVLVYASVLLCLAYRGARLWQFATVAAVGLLILSLVGAAGTVATVIGTLLIAPLVALSVVPLRRALLTRGIFGGFRKVLPQMSPTEQAALDAGDVWWEAELFRGKPDWSKLSDFPYTELTADEQAFLDNETATLCEMIDDWETHFERKDLAPEVWDYIRRNGFFAMLIKKEHGGLGFSAVAQSAVVSKIATRSLTAAVTVMVPNSLGPGELLTHYGTLEQKQYWLPRLASGEEIPCFGLTGPEVGSDASNLPDIGIVEKRVVDGREVLGMRLNFSKRYITLAPVATVVGLAFRLQDPDGLMGEAGKDYGITCALVRSDTPGVEIGRRHYPGAAFMNGPIVGTDVFVPLDAIIGGPKMAGQGWRMLVECLSAGRGISLPALAAASGKGMYGATGAYTAIRRQFKLPVGRFEGVQEALARIGGLTYTLEAARILTASAVDHCSPSVVTAMMKYHMTEMMRRVLQDAMDIHGGRAIIMGPRNYLAVPYQALPVAITVEGANIMTRSLIVFGQGAIRCHPFVYREMEAARNNDLVDFDAAFWGHIGFTINRGVRALAHGLSFGRLARSPVRGPMRGYYRQVERLSCALALCADVSMGVLGGELKRRESTSARLGDVLSQLYLATAVLKYYENHASEDDLVHARWAVENALAEAGRAFHEFFRNFPRAGVGRALRTLVFPFGIPYELPSDELGRDIAGRMLRMNEVSERMKQDIYVGTTADDATGRLMLTWEALLAVQDVYERFLKQVSSGQVVGETLKQQLSDAEAKGLLTADESRRIAEYDALRYDAILTDDFSPAYLTAGQSAKEDVRAVA